MKYLPLLCLLLIATTTFAQPKEADSLARLLKTKLTYVQKENVLYELSNA